MIKKVAIITNGGDCPGLNAVIRAIVKTAETNGVECYGYIEGYKGLYKNEYIKLESNGSASGLLHRGGTIIGSSNSTNLFNLKVEENGQTVYKDVSDECIENVRKAGLSVLCFTGALIEDLRLNPINRKLLYNIDLLIDGEFVIDKVDYSRPWCGSSNQRYHFLTSRYNDEIFAKYKNKVEVNISKSGVIFMNGMGNFDEILQKIDLVKLKKWYNRIMIERI